jgi:hypothetical protein
MADPFSLFKKDDVEFVETSIGAKQTIRISPEKCEIKDDDTLLNAQMHIVRRFLLGDITYEDWVEPGKVHETRFAHELIVKQLGDPKASPANNGLTGAILTSVPIGRNNCTDDDCPN